MNTPSTVVAIVLGASEWPNAPALSAPASFKNSAAAIRNYFHSLEGMHLPQDNVLDRFDSDKAGSAILKDIANFLRDRRSGGVRANTLLLYYVGHGTFSGEDYLLALRSTDTQLTAASSLRMRDLASAILKNSSGMRRYLILDCCFAAAAYKEFQSAPLQVATRRVQRDFAKEGTALLCASGARDPAKAPNNEPYTMFSGALLNVLQFGNSAAPAQLSLADVGDLTADLVRTRYLDDAIRPEVHTPEKRKGDVALIPLFPNRALKSNVESRLSAVEQQLTTLIQVTRRLEEQLAAPPASASATLSPVEPRPLFELLVVSKTLQFTSPDGHTVGHFVRRQKMRANSLATEFWICAIGADGPIANMALEGDNNPHLEYIHNAGLIDVVARYAAAIPPAQVLELKLEYELQDSFKKDVEYLGHQVQHATEEVVLEIQFGKKKCLMGEIHRKYAGSTVITGIPVERSSNGSSLKAVIRNLKIGEEYRLVWRW